MPILGVIASSAKGAPGIPTIGTATNVGTARAYNNGAATVTFTAGAGAVATSFTATSSPGGFTATGASSPLTVTGLQSATSYTFTVTATNAAGTSAASSASNSITATTVPQAPTIGTATGADSSATVTFTAGATGGATVTTFTATSSPSSITGTSATSPITVSGLANGTAYTFTVTATNVNGTSTASAASNSVTPADPYTASWDYIAEGSPNGTGFLTFSSLPSGYQEFKIIGKTRSAESIGYTQINNLTSNYGEFAYFGNQGGFASTAGNATSSGQVRRYAVSNSASNSHSPMMIDYFGANSTVSQKPMQIMSTYGANLTPAFQFTWAQGMSNTTNAITTITLGSGNGPSPAGDFVTPTVFTVYGLKEGTAI
jgi:hypothetical protein